MASLPVKDRVSVALKGEAARALITLDGNSGREGQNGDILHVPQPHRSTKALAASLHAAS